MLLSRPRVRLVPPRQLVSVGRVGDGDDSHNPHQTPDALLGHTVPPCSSARLASAGSYRKVSLGTGGL